VVIRLGQIEQNTADFTSFVQAAAPVWPAVSVILSQLQALCQMFKVPLGVVECRLVLQLATASRSSDAHMADVSPPASIVGHDGDLEGSPAEAGNQPKSCRSLVGSIATSDLSDLLCCFANLDDIEPYLTVAMSGQSPATGTPATAAPVVSASGPISTSSTSSSVSQQRATPIAMLKLVAQAPQLSTLRLHWRVMHGKLQ